MSSGATLPLPGHIDAWQMTFVAVGAPGLIIVVLCPLALAYQALAPYRAAVKPG